MTEYFLQKMELPFLLISESILISDKSMRRIRAQHVPLISDDRRISRDREDIVKRGERKSP